MPGETTRLVALLVAPLAGALVLPSPLDAAFAAPALMLVPGYSWVRALQQRTGWAPSTEEGVVFGIALSLAGLALGGVLLSALSIPLSATSWTLLVGASTAPAIVLLVTSDLTAGGAARATRPARPLAAPGATTVAVAVIAVIAVTGAVVVTLRSDAINRQPLTDWVG